MKKYWFRGLFLGIVYSIILLVAFLLISYHNFDGNCYGFWGERYNCSFFDSFSVVLIFGGFGVLGFWLVLVPVGVSVGVGIILGLIYKRRPLKYGNVILFVSTLLILSALGYNEYSNGREAEMKKELGEVMASDFWYEGKKNTLTPEEITKTADWITYSSSESESVIFGKHFDFRYPRSWDLVNECTGTICHVKVESPSYGEFNVSCEFKLTIVKDKITSNTVSFNQCRNDVFLMQKSGQIIE